MHRLFAIAVLGAIAVVPSGLAAQHRGFGGGMGGGMRFSGGGHFAGGGHFSGGAGRGAFAGPAIRTGSGFRSGPVVGGGFGFRRFDGGFRRFGDFDDRFRFGGVGFGHNPRFHVFFRGCVGCGFARRRFFYPYYPYAYAYPAYYPPYDYVDYASPYGSNPTVVVQSQPANYEASYENQQLAAEVRGLSEEVRQLREQQSAAQQPPRSAQNNASPERAVTTVLVFRDGHRSEITNYAVVGQTLWIFNERRATKVLISDLDLPASRAVNEERGVDFSVR